MCVGKLKFPIPQRPDWEAELFFGVPARPSGVSRRHVEAAQSSGISAAGPIDAILKSGLSDDGAPVGRSWRPISELECTAADTGGGLGPQ